MPSLSLSLSGHLCPGLLPFSSITHFPKAKHSRVTCWPTSAYVSAGNRALMLGAKSLGSEERDFLQIRCKGSESGAVTQRSQHSSELTLS